MHLADGKLRLDHQEGNVNIDKTQSILERQPLLAAPQVLPLQGLPVLPGQR